MSDISSVFVWWFTIFLLGIVFLPTACYFFGKFADRGYIFAKVIGIIISSYIVWLLGSLQILPFTRITLIVVLLGSAISNLYLFNILKQKKAFTNFPFGLAVFEEILFFTGLAFWSYVRATEPSIRGLEKFMDFGFVNSILRSNFFPPQDMWLTYSPDYPPGSFINYYYFGHYITAFLTKLSGIDSAVTYNLMLATLFAFTFTLSFSMGMNLYFLFQIINTKLQLVKSQIKSTKTRLDGRVILVGLLAAFLVAFAGNLHPLYIFTSGYPNEEPKPPWTLELGFHPERYWYPNATRFIPFTIHEFPIYSFVVADLHGHVSDIPMVLLVLAILLALIFSKTEDTTNKNQVGNFLADFANHTSIPLPQLIFLGLLLSVMYMTNAWDGIIYMGLSGLVFLYLNLSKVILASEEQARPGSQSDSGQARMTIFNALYKTFSASLFLVFFFLIGNLPFSLNFKPFVSGIGVLCAPQFLLGKTLGPFLFEVGKCQKSPLFMLATLWGFFYFSVLGFLAFIVIPSIRKRLKGLTSHFSFITPIDIFILLLILISSLLLIFPEFFYIKDIYPAHYRANTMFKLGYQAFMMLGLSSAYIFIRIRQLNYKSFGSSIFYFIFYILFFLVAIYPYFAINSYYGGLKTYLGLYGLNWIASQYPDDYKGIVWLRKNIQCDSPALYRSGTGPASGKQCNNQPVIVEANGDSYTDYARVSANTGLPTIIGWPVHEWLWRGSYDEAGRRIPEVAAIYESKDLEQTKAILRKYAVEYIFVGTLERQKYPNLDEEKLQNLGKVIFESGKTKIIKVAPTLL
jgi:YYY domain-containing protein